MGGNVDFTFVDSLNASESLIGISTEPFEHRRSLSPLSDIKFQINRVKLRGRNDKCTLEDGDAGREVKLD